MPDPAHEPTPKSHAPPSAQRSAHDGPITRMVQDAYFGVVKGSDTKHDAWLTYV